MTTLIFSDVHASHQPNSTQLQRLYRVIEQADRVIINGDFWDGYITTFDKFINSGWQVLFTLLKKRHTIYLVGNHDARQWMDERWQLFADQLLDQYRLKAGKTTFLIEHGHRQAYSFGLYYPRLTLLFGWLYPYLDRIEEGGHLLTPVYRKYLQVIHDDKDLLSYAKVHKKAHQWHIFGHTHLQKQSRESGYLNPGSFRCGVSNWLTIDERGKIVLFSEKYHD